TLVIVGNDHGASFSSPTAGPTAVQLILIPNQKQSNQICLAMRQSSIFSLSKGSLQQTVADPNSSYTSHLHPYK
ncbi:MAG: hypothetical protein JAY95_09750, partial [Candidatus Thiodiazotropha taylori]|nr:hypothetical protein [Candidatus Thiodiazotropha taylori]